MGETYQFVWGEVGHIRRAIGIARKLVNDVEYAHIETDNYDLDMDRIGIRITIPHMKVLDEERKSL
ncbi:hypothetical protein ES703_96122 [subsurface metagenome]